MKLDQPYKCDYCANFKGVANHWWLRKPLSAPPESFYLRPWDDVLAQESGVEHICSEQCADKALSKWMAAQRSRACAVVSWSPTARLDTFVPGFLPPLRRNKKAEE